MMSWLSAEMSVWALPSCMETVACVLLFLVAGDESVCVLESVVISTPEVKLSP